MKRLTTLLLLVMIFCGSAALAANGVAIVKSVKGDVKVKRDGATTPLKPGSRLQNGDVIITGGAGRVGVIFNDGSVLALKENSFLRIKDFTFKPIEQQFNFDLFLKKGTALFESGKIGKLSPKDFKFEIPKGTIGIRGTKFLVEVK